MATGYFDPDEDEAQARGKRPAWSKPKKEFTKEAMAACRRQFFNTRDEQKRWDLIEQKTLGSTEEDYLYLCWVKHKIAHVKAVNAKVNQFSFGALMTMIENEEKRIEWTTNNRKRLLDERRNKGNDQIKDEFVSAPKE